MNKETEERIISEIRKSGHPTSIKASNILIKNGWYVKNSPRYFDNNLKKYREIDLTAQKKSFIFNHSNDYLIVECKKNSSCPWIFFKQKNKNRSVYTLNIAESTQGRVYDALKHHKVFEKHPYYERELSTYYLIGHKNPGTEEGREIDKAINQVMGALYFYVNQLMGFVDKSNWTLKYPSFYYPVIVFEGDLYGVELDGESINVKEENHISLLVESELEEPAIMNKLNDSQKLPLFSKQIIIDVVKLSYLEEYLNKLKLKNQNPIDKDKESAQS